jgi:hypothetical protein
MASSSSDRCQIESLSSGSKPRLPLSRDCERHTTEAPSPALDEMERFREAAHDTSAFAGASYPMIVFRVA